MQRTEESHPFLRITGACFCGGVLTFLAVSLLAPSLHAGGTILATLGGALLGFIASAPIAFARAIPVALREAAPIASAMIDSVILYVDTLRDILTPRPILWLGIGAPALLAEGLFLRTFGGELAWNLLSIGVVGLLFFSCFVPLMGMVMGLWGLLEMHLLDSFPRIGERFWYGRDDHQPGYWARRFDRELEARGRGVGMLSEYYFEPLPWGTSILYLLDVFVVVPLQFSFVGLKAVCGRAVSILQVVFVEFPCFLFKLFRLVHTNVRLICMVDAPLGALAVYLWALVHFNGEPTHMGRETLALWAMGGGAASVAFGIVNYALIARVWLKTLGQPVPAPAKSRS